MKKTLKALCLGLVVVFVLSTFTACGISKEEAVGMWECSYTYEGSSYYALFELESDGTFAKVTLKDGNYNTYTSGDWELEGRTLKLYDSEALTYHGQWMEFKYKNGGFENGDHLYTKTEE